MLRYLVEDYWGRRSGWPDLIVFRDNEFFFAEVKLRRISWERASNVGFATTESWIMTLLPGLTKVALFKAR